MTINNKIKSIQILAVIILVISFVTLLSGNSNYPNTATPLSNNNISSKSTTMANSELNQYETPIKTTSTSSLSINIDSNANRNSVNDDALIWTDKTNLYYQYHHQINTIKMSLPKNNIISNLFKYSNSYVYVFVNDDSAQGQGAISIYTLKINAATLLNGLVSKKLTIDTPLSGTVSTLSISQNKYFYFKTTQNTTNIQTFYIFELDKLLLTQRYHKVISSSVNKTNIFQYHCLDDQQEVIQKLDLILFSHKVNPTTSNYIEVKFLEWNFDTPDDNPAWSPLTSTIPIMYNFIVTNAAINYITVWNGSPKIAFYLQGYNGRTKFGETYADLLAIPVLSNSSRKANFDLLDIHGFTYSEANNRDIGNTAVTKLSKLHPFWGGGDLFIPWINLSPDHQQIESYGWKVMNIDKSNDLILMSIDYNLNSHHNFSLNWSYQLNVAIVGILNYNASQNSKPLIQNFVFSCQYMGQNPTATQLYTQNQIWQFNSIQVHTNNINQNINIDLYPMFNFWNLKSGNLNPFQTIIFTTSHYNYYFETTYFGGPNHGILVKIPVLNSSIYLSSSTPDPLSDHPEQTSVYGMSLITNISFQDIDKASQFTISISYFGNNNNVTIGNDFFGIQKPQYANITTVHLDKNKTLTSVIHAKHKILSILALFQYWGNFSGININPDQTLVFKVTNVNSINLTYDNINLNNFKFDDINADLLIDFDKYRAWTVSILAGISQNPKYNKGFTIILEVGKNVNDLSLITWTPESRPYPKIAQLQTSAIDSITQIAAKLLDTDINEAIEFNHLDDLNSLKSLLHHTHHTMPTTKNQIDNYENTNQPFAIALQSIIKKYDAYKKKNLTLGLSIGLGVPALALIIFTLIRNYKFNKKED